MPRTRVFLIALLVILGIVAYSSVYTVHERDQALVLQFGKVVKLEPKPGLHFKMPFVQTVQSFDRRVLDLDVPPEEMPTLDQKQTVVDMMARYRITNPLQFFQAAKTTENFEKQLVGFISSGTRAVFGEINLADLLTAKRAGLMQEIAKRVRAEIDNKYGVELIDVRLKRLDLPPQNSKAIFRRMESQRRQEAIGIRAEGERDAKRIRADADKDGRIIKAEAERKSQVLRGEGEATAQAIYNKAYGQDPKFFQFWISMNAMRISLTNGTTRYIGPADGDFFRYFGNINGTKTPANK